MTNLIDPNRVRFGPYEVDLHTCEIWKFGTRMKLVGQPFEILRVLVSRPGELVTRDELREKLWPSQTFVDFNHGLNAAMNKLRDLLSDSADDPKYIETLPRRGYRFIAKVDRGGTDELAGIVPETHPSSAGNMAAVETSFMPPAAEADHRLDHGISRTFLGVLAGAALLVLFVAIFAIFGSRSKPVQPPLVLDAGIHGAQRIVAYGGKNGGPQFSPDGKRLVFMSDRSGTRELWVSKSDGSEAKQITSLGDTGTPRWSPDGKTIAFDSNLHGTSAIFAVNADGGDPRVLVSGAANNSVPSWSHDGQYLYFSSDRGEGRFQVWRLVLKDGKQEQITKNGGFAPLESPDGKTIYYAESRYPNPHVWQVPREGGAETMVASQIQPGTWASWSVTNKGIYFVDAAAGNVAMLSFFDLASHQLKQLTMLGRFPFWMTVSEDGKRAAFDRDDSEDTATVVELEDFQ